MATELGAFAGGIGAALAVVALVEPHVERGTADTGLLSLVFLLVLVLAGAGGLAAGSGFGAYWALRWRGHPGAGSTGTLVALAGAVVALRPEVLIVAPATPIVARYFALRVAPPPA